VDDPLEDPLFSVAFRKTMETSVTTVAAEEELNDWASQLVP